MSDFSFIANAHPGYIDEMYQRYQASPESVEESWRAFFKGFDYASQSTNGHSENGTAKTASTELDVKEFQVLSLIRAFRNRGHL